MFSTGAEMKIAALIFGLGAMLSLFLIYQQKTRKRMIVAKLSADICWVAHYLCLGGIAGMIQICESFYMLYCFLQDRNTKEK